MVAYETLLVDEARAALRVRLNRPERQNTITDAMLDDLHRVLDLAEASPDCRLVAIEGVDDVFCTGMDLAEAAAQEPGPGSAERFFALLRRFTMVPRLVVSKVDGRVSGGGVGLVAASDFVIATEASMFSLPEALWGLLPCCVLPFLIRRVGFQKAYTMTLTTQPVRATQAHAFHLVDEVSSDPDAALRPIAFRMGKLSSATLADAKRYFGRMWAISAETESLAVTELNRLLETPAVRDAIGSFATRREFPWNRPR